jgi:hypothetical protein
MYPIEECLLLELYDTRRRHFFALGHLSPSEYEEVR